MDNPFEVAEKKFWSVNVVPKFLLRGVPRVCTILFWYLIVFILTLFFTQRNLNYQHWVLRWSCRLKLWLCGYKNIECSNQDWLKMKNTDAQIIFCKHSSYIDIGMMCYLMPEVKFVASSYVKNIPIINKFGRYSCIYMESEFGGNSLTEKIQKEIDKGHKILYFGEGVCSRGDHLLKLRNGMFVPKKKILPIHIEYEEHNNWVMGEQDMIQHFLQQLANFKNKVKVRVLNEYDPNEEDKNDIEKFKENFRDYYIKNLNLIKSKKSYQDHTFYKLKLDKKTT